MGINDDRGNGDRVDVVHELGRRGRELIAESMQRGRAALTADQAAQREQQASGR